MGAEAVQGAVAALRAAYDELAALPIDALTKSELIGALDEVETLTCQLPTQSHRMLARLQTETTAKEMGAKSWREVLAIRWRISTGEAGRRLDEAAQLAPRRTLTGEALEPELACTAAAQARGVINAEHLKVVRETMGRIPAAVDSLTRAQIEVDLVGTAMGVGPRELKNNAERILFLLDQDGPEPDDAERARRRGVSTGPQGPDKMTPFRGTLTPEATAIYEAIYAKWAAPGMCNPADENPCVSGTPTQEQIDADDRSLAQRQHDALVAVGRSVLESGELGQHNGLPTSIIIRTTLQDLESRAGVGVTGGGTVIPISDVIRLAAHANHYLAVFDKATGSALDLFRARRVASSAQRIMLIAREGGCTKPGCTVGAYGSQVHHAARDWAQDGQTNVDELGLACGPDNRMVGPGGWTTRINDDHDVEWIPPPHLDTGQARINNYHRPERLHRPLVDDDGGGWEPNRVVEAADVGPTNGVDDGRDAPAANVDDEVRDAPATNGVDDGRDAPAANVDDEDHGALAANFDDEVQDARPINGHFEGLGVRILNGDNENWGEPAPNADDDDRDAPAATDDIESRAGPEPDAA